MKFEWITDWESINSESFQEQWLQWLEQANNSHVFFHPAMAKVWIDTYTPLRNIAPMYCIVKDKDRTVFIPLILWKKNWKNAFENTIVPVGFSDFDYHDPLVVGKEIENWENFWMLLVSEISEKFKNKFDTISLDGIRQRSSGMSKEWQEVEPCPYIDLTPFDTKDDFVQSLKKNLRQDLRRRSRRLEENEDISFKVFGVDNITEALDTLPTLLHYHIQRWPNAYKAPHFHENIIKTLLPLGILHFSCIMLEQKPISWRIGFIYKDCYYSYMPTFIPEYNKYSPGKLHLLYCIEDAIKLKLKKYDQLRGAELYKNEWTKTTDTVWQFNKVQNTTLSLIKTKLISLKNELR